MDLFAIGLCSKKIQGEVDSAKKESLEKETPFLFGTTEMFRF